MLEDAIRDPQTPPEARADLLARLAALRASHGDFSDAGEALVLQAELTSRLKGALAPELAGIYADAADAYLKAAGAALALDPATSALRLDQAYAECDSVTLARDHARLVGIFTALGRAADAADERILAGSAEERCARAGTKAGPRGIVVTGDVAPTGPDSFARVNIFYATDRARSGSDRPNDFYGGERGPLEYGQVEVTVPRIHKPGAIEAPSLIRLEWSENPERHFVIARIATQTGAEMFSDLRQALQQKKSDEVFVFIHGYNVSFADAAKRTAQIAYDLNFDGVPILYSWPSRASTLSYLSDEAVVRLSGRHLLAFLEQVVAQSGAKRINLIAHSMGNRALADALELLATGRTAAGVTAPLFDEVVFAAPDEDTGLFAEMVHTIRPLARRLTLYGSDSDLAILASREVHGEAPRAGEGAASMLISRGLDSVDMSALGEDMLGHSYFATSSSALTDILLLFWHDRPPDQRCGMTAKIAAGSPFWQFDPQRCDGPVVLSALTMLKANGSATLATIDTILAKLAADPAKHDETQEWKAIREVVVATASPSP